MKSLSSSFVLLSLGLLCSGCGQQPETAKEGTTQAGADAAHENVAMTPDENLTAIVPKAPDPYNGGIQLPSGWRVWADMRSFPDPGQNFSPEIEVKFANLSRGSLPSPIVENAQLIDDRGTVYACTNPYSANSRIGWTPPISQGFDVLKAPAPKPGFHWLMVVIPAKDFQSEGVLGFKITAATLRERSAEIRRLTHQAPLAEDGEQASAAPRAGDELPPPTAAPTAPSHGERIPSKYRPNEQQTKMLAKLKEIGFSCDGDPIAYSPVIDLSPDGTTCAYRTRSLKGESVVFNGLLLGPYPAIDGDIFLSDDGSTVAFKILRDPTKPQLRTLVINGKEVATQANMGPFFVGPQGKRFAFLVDQNLCVGDKLAGKYYRFGELAFSPHGEHVLWTAAEQQSLDYEHPGGYDVWFDGRKIPAHFQNSGSFSFSQDGKRWAVCGQTVGPMTLEKRGVGEVATMVDGRMLPASDPRVGLIHFATGTNDLVYVGCNVASETCAVYRNGKRGKTWYSIDSQSLKLIEGGKGVAFTGFQEPPGHVAGVDPLFNGRRVRPRGEPSLVIDDAIVVPNCSSWALSEDGRHSLADQMTDRRQTDGRFKHVLVYDGKKVAEIVNNKPTVEMRLSPAGSHWLAWTAGSRLDYKTALHIDGVKLALPPETELRYMAIDDTGAVKTVLCVGGTVWRATIAPRR